MGWFSPVPPHPHFLAQWRGGRSMFLAVRRMRQTDSGAHAKAEVVTIHCRDVSLRLEAKGAKGELAPK